MRRALAALLATRDLPGITVQMIVTEAGIGYATFFRHYSTIEDLLIDVADTMMREFVTAAMPAIVSGDRAAMLSALVDYVAARRGAVRAVLAGGGETVRGEIVRRAMAQALPLSSRFDPAIPVELAVIHAVTGTIDILSWWTDRDDVDHDRGRPDRPPRSPPAHAVTGDRPGARLNGVGGDAAGGR